jgi:murein DD-endopeptidase MepM/ murein hydrolase activator NlpD
LVVGGRAAHAEDVETVSEAAAVPSDEDEDAPSGEPAADTSPSAPVAPKTYTVQASDTMYSIAKKHGVSVDALLWANDLKDPDVLKAGQKLVIPPSTGKLYVAKDGDTLESLATTYGVSKSGIAAVNGLSEDGSLKVGQRLLIPVKSGSGDPAFTPVPLSAASAEEPVSIPQNAGTGSPTPPVISAIAPVIQVPGVMTATGAPSVTVTNRKVPKLAWPVTVKAPKSGVSQGFRPGHTGIDIFTAAGTPIKAAASGTVKMAEKNPDGFSGYGWIVIIDHGDGISTWYAHCGSFAVKEGEKVKAGDTIGTVGMTGRTSGPHLHFELRISTSAIDPRLALS